MDELEALRRRVERERVARKAAEQFAEAKTRELYEANQSLTRLAASLQERVDLRTAELKRIAEEALAASRTKSLFLSNVSHELRTPLNAILGYGELLGEELVERGEPGLGDLAGRMIEAAHHLHALVNDLLDLQKIEVGKLVLAFADVDVAAVIAAVGDAVGPALRRHDNVLRVEIAPEARRLWTDELRLRQILSNLLSNAAKFTQNGEVVLRVGLEERAGRPGLLFEVADTGAGMSVEQVGRLFVPYVQVDEALARRHGGTGLGLALTQQLCRLLGGEISVESEAGRGSCFRVYLPLVPASA
jgi:signal transduction histidine kinase